MVAELRSKGATVVLLLSQLGKVESEDLVNSVEGIDAVMVGRESPVIQSGRMIKNTVACYGGEQGQYVCRTELTLDAQHHATTGVAETVMLSPEVGENPDVLKLVKSFEDGFNEKLRKAEIEKAAKQSSKAGTDSSPEHFLGQSLCTRCHAAEGEQWKTTAHSVAWQTLVELKKDATPDCVPCHVLGYQQPGGFQSAVATPQKVNVKCENCHGMGTQHDAYALKHQVTEATCRGCHNSERDPEFNWEKKMPLIVHSNLSGETLKNRNVNANASKMMKSSGSH
jgi:hypothetical protein